MLQLLQSYAPDLTELCSSPYRVMLHMIQSYAEINHPSHSTRGTRGGFLYRPASQKRSLRDSYLSSSIASISSIWSIIS